MAACRCARKISIQSPVRSGFTLVELLVVIAIIAVLIGLLLPTLASARASARLVLCTSNIHQLGVGLFTYAADYKGNYPPNVTTPSPQSWLDSDKVPRYLPMGTGSASVYICPEDDGAQRSYSMNIWASSKADKSVTNPPPPLPIEELWPHARKSSSMILFAESWSYQGSASMGWQAPPTIGARGDLTTTGQMFGALGGIPPYFAGHWGTVNCELVYERHRKSNAHGLGTQPYGRIAICFDDGHAMLCSDTDLVRLETGQSTGLAAWSPLDYVRN